MGVMQVLVVEDDGVVAMSLASRLRRLGYAVPALVSRGEDAVEKAHQLQPDLVLMDIQLKGEMDGVEAAELIRRELGIPVVYLTAFADNDLLQRAKATDPFGYLIKPFEVKELHSTIEMAMYKHAVTKKLQEGEARYRAIVEDQMEYVNRFSPDWSLTFANGAYCWHVGVPKGEIIGENVLRFLPQEYRQVYQEMVEGLNPENLTGELIMREISPDEVGECWIHWTCRAICSPQQCVVEYQCVGRDITRNVQAEKLLEHRLEIEALVSSISTRFVNIAVGEIDGEIVHGLRDIVEFSGADGCFVRLLSEDGKVYGKGFEWTREGGQRVDDPYRGVAIEQYGWLNEQLKKNDVIVIPAVDDMPPAASAERKLWEENGVTARIVIPMRVGDVLWGFMGLDWKQAVGEWTEEDLRLYRMAAEVFAAALARQHAKRELLESKQRLELALEGGNLGIWDWKPKKHDVVFDRRWVEMLGYQEGELENCFETWSERLHPDDEERVMRLVEAHCLGKTDRYSVEMRLKTKSGEWKWIQAHGKAFKRDENGEAVRMTGIHMDISARKEAEAARFESERKLRSLVNQSHDGIVLVDEEGTVIEWNDGMENITGITYLEANRMPLMEVQRILNPELSNSPERFAELAAQIEKGLSTGNPSWMNQRIESKIEIDGETRTVQQSAFTIKTKKGYMLAAIVRDITERVWMESELRQAKEELEKRVLERTRELEQQRAFLQQVIDSDPNYIFVKNMAGEYIMVNKASAKSFGISIENLIGKRDDELNADAGRVAEVRRQDMQVMESLQDLFIPEEQVFLPDGEKRWVQTVKRPIVGPDGRASQVLGVLMDITERKQFEEVLDRQRAFLQQVIDSDPIYVFVKDAEGRYLLVNQAWADVYAMPKEEIVGKTDADLNDNVERVEIIRKQDNWVLQNLEDMHIPEERFTLRSGRDIWVQTIKRPIMGSDGKASQVLGVLVNITERKKTEEALRQSENRWRGLFENSPLCMFEIDFSQFPPIVLEANPRVSSVFGWQPKEILKLKMTDIVPEDSVATLEHVIRILQGGNTASVELVMKRRNGSRFPARINATPSTFSGLTQAVFVIEDITMEKQRRSEEEAITAERQRIAREIHDGIAQDLAALRVRIGIWHDLVEGDKEKMHQELEFLSDALLQNIRGVRRSIFALRPMSLEKQGFFLALREFASGFGDLYPLKVDLFISGDEDRLPHHLEPVLFRIVQEGLHNVGKHAQADRVSVDFDLQLEEQVQLVISDNGIGFAKEELPGAVLQGHLGLAQMRERVEEVNGVFEVESDKGSGTVLKVVLPLNY